MFASSTRRDNWDSRWRKRHSQLGTFSTGLFLLAFPRVSQPKGDRKGCVSIGPLDLGFYPNVLVVHDKVAVSTLWSNPNSRSLNNLGASLVFTCCTRKLHHSLFPPFLADVRSYPELWAAVMCEGDASCSVTTAYPPASSLTLSPRRTTLPWYFCNCSASSERITRQKVHEGCEVHCCVVRLDSAMTSSLLRTSDSSQA